MLILLTIKHWNIKIIIGKTKKNEGDFIHMQIKTVIAIPARGSGPVGAPSGKKTKVSVDKLRLRSLSDQLSELVEELDDIKEDLNEMLADLEGCYDEDYADADEETPYERMDNICGAVDGAYTELNEALDEMERIC